MTSPASSRLISPAGCAFAFNCFGEASLAERVDAAHAAGFVEIGLSIRWMGLWLDQGHDLAELDALLDEYGMRVGELEALRVMQDQPAPLMPLARQLAERYHPARFQVIGDYDGTLEQAAARLAAVADEFAAWDVEVVLEPLPFTNIPTPAAAAQLIRMTGRTNVSMCLDIWHLYRAGLTLDHLDDLWDTISTLQLNDGTVIAENPNLYDDCLANRRVLGQGEFDLVGLLQRQAEHRPDAMYSMEVISTGLRGQSPHLTATQIAEGINAIAERLRQEG